MPNEPKNPMENLFSTYNPEPSADFKRRMDNMPWQQKTNSSNIKNLNIMLHTLLQPRYRWVTAIVCFSILTGFSMLNKDVRNFTMSLFQRSSSEPAFSPNGPKEPSYQRYVATKEEAEKRATFKLQSPTWLPDGIILRDGSLDNFYDLPYEVPCRKTYQCREVIEQKFRSKHVTLDQDFIKMMKDNNPEYRYKNHRPDFTMSLFQGYPGQTNLGASTIASDAQIETVMIGSLKGEYLKGGNVAKEVKTAEGTYNYIVWDTTYSSQQLKWRKGDTLFYLRTDGTKGNVKYRKGQPAISKADLIRVAESVQ